MTVTVGDAATVVKGIFQQQAKTVAALDGSSGVLPKIGEGGLIANEFGHAQAHSIYRIGKKQQAVGVLVGADETDRRVFGEVMYQSFHVTGTPRRAISSVVR